MADNDKNMDSLDRFFQKKAGEYDIPYREDDWLKLEKQLDVRDIRKSYQTRTHWIAAASILIAACLGYFTYENHARLNQLGQQFHQETPRGSGDATQGLVPGEDSGQTPSEAQEETASEPSHSDIDYADPPLLALDSPSSSPSSVNEDARARVTGESRVANFFDNKETHFIAYRDVPGVTQIESSATGRNITALAVETGKKPQSTYFPEEVSHMQGVQRLSASFLMAPDLSTVNSLSNFYDPGYKIGLSVEYRLSPRLSVAAGAIQSSVRYRASAGQYNPATYWGNGSSPDDITGVCLLIDIPVTLKYNFLNLSGSRFYATTGLSSYIMLNEDYRFSYNSYEADQQQGWSGSTGTTHLMSNAGFSVGYELDVHPNWSLRAEPFIRVPLREVGWSNVRLYSVGSFVSLSYNFGAGR